LGGLKLGPTAQLLKVKAAASVALTFSRRQ
jgi:hypothetical protein